MGEKLSRREFLRRAAAGGVAIAGASGVGSTVAAALGQGATDASGKSRVISVRNTASIGSDGSLSADTIKKMLSQGVAKLAGAKSASKGWQKYFKPDDVVGIKVNCLFGRNASTHPEVVDAIIAGLVSAGVNADNIIVWDRSTGDLVKSGFTVNADGPGPKFYANDGQWGQQFTLGSFSGKLPSVLTDKITAMINVPILKHHGIAGVSCALKNHYGTISNPGECHGDGCNPYLADINALEPIRNKTRLVVVDAIRPFPDGGPGLKNRAMLWDYHTIMVSTDPVAADYVGWQIIEDRRKDIGLKPLNQPAKWLANATARGVGNSDPSKIEIIRI